MAISKQKLFDELAEVNEKDPFKISYTDEEGVVDTVIMFGNTEMGVGLLAKRLFSDEISIINIEPW